MLIVVTLTGDASAGPIGYMPLTDVRADADGKVIEYAADHDLNGPMWEPAEPELFGTLLRTCGFSIAEAADYLKVSEPTVKHWSSGRRAAPNGVYAELSKLHDSIIHAASGQTREEVAERSAGLPTAAAKAALALFLARD